MGAGLRDMNGTLEAIKEGTLEGTAFLGVSAAVAGSKRSTVVAIAGSEKPTVAIDGTDTSTAAIESPDGQRATSPGSDKVSARARAAISARTEACLIIIALETIGTD